MLQGVCFLNQSLKVSAPQPAPTPNFLNAPMTFDLLFLLKNFQTNKFDALRGSFDQKLISPNVSTDMQKLLFHVQFYLEKTLAIVQCCPTCIAAP